MQYSLRMQIDKRNEKRAFYTLSAMKGKASLTVEAAMVVPLFIFAIIYVIYGMNVIQLQSKIQCALDTTALEMAGYAPSAQIEGDNIVGEFISEIIYTNLGGKVLFLNNLKKCGGEMELVYRGENGFSFSKSRILRENSEIYLEVSYQISLPDLLGIKIKFPCVQNAYIRGFTGISLKDSRNQIIVYITTGQTVYHKSRECSHLNLSIQKVKKTEVNKKKYSMCSLCKNRQETENVYITEDGSKYHKSLSCKSLKRTIQRVALAEVSDRRGCMRCTGS